MSAIGREWTKREWGETGGQPHSAGAEAAFVLRVTLAVTGDAVVFRLGRRPGLGSAECHDGLQFDLSAEALHALADARTPISIAVHAHRTRAMSAAGEGDGGAGLALWQLRRLEAFVNAGLDRAISVAQLAGQCRLSASHFSRRFSASLGMSPHRWLTVRRVGRAKQMLLDGISDLCQIALACGFVDQSHLTRVFNQFEGQSPGRWRRQHSPEPCFGPAQDTASRARSAATARLNAT